MKLRRPQVLAALVALAACSGSSTGPEVAQVRITPENPSQQVGLTVQFSAEALDAGGQVITGLPVTWMSNTESVATVDANGLATALSVGTTSITATIAGVPDSEVLTVNPNQCTNRVDVVLNPGEFQAYPASTCLLLPAGAPGDLYRVAVVRPTQVEDEDDVPNVTLAIDPVLTTAAATAPARVGPRAPERIARLGGLDGTRFVDEARIRARTRAYHTEMRRRERTLPLSRALPSRAALAPPALAPAPARLDLKVERQCAVATTRPALHVASDDFVAIYQDSVQRQTDPLSATAANLLVSYYTSYVRDMIADYWGAPSDIDANGRLIVTTSPTLPEDAAAVVWSGDFLDTADCAGSNEAEIIYYANDVFADLSHTNPDSVSYFALGVLAHEAKHVSSIYRRVVNGPPVPFHDVWIEEGTAEIAQVMSSRIAWAATGGPAVNARITGDDIRDAAQAAGGTSCSADACITKEMWGLVGEVADLIVQMTSHPNSFITDPNGASEFHTFYAGSWHLHRLVGDAWGGAATAPFADAPLFSDMTDASTPGLYGSLAQATGRSFAELFDDLVVAISTHETGHTATRSFTTWDLVSATDIFTNPPEVAPVGVYPWPVTRTSTSQSAPFAGATFSGPIGPSGMRFHDFVSAGAAAAQIMVTGAGGSGRIIVTRLD